jgi:opacity protein-like surface antigen
LKLKIALIAAAIAFTGTAFAQEKKNSLSLFGNISGSSGSDPSSTIALGLGRLFGDSLELEGNLIHAGTPTSDTNIVGLGLKYYLRPVGKGGSVLPYLRAGVQVMSSSTDNTCFSATQGSYACGTTDTNDTTATLGGGLDFAVSESVFPFVEITTSKSSKSNSSGTNYLVQLGVRIRY